MNNGTFSQKHNVNPPQPHSISKPITNSNLPSAKSKEVRLVSARQQIYQTKDKGKEKSVKNKTLYYRNHLDYIYKSKQDQKLK
jgi:hypothetical protein